MSNLLKRLPLLIVLFAIGAMLVYGPIAQLPHYHVFADTRAWLGLPNAGDVLSNLGFLIIGAWGLARLWPRQATLAPGPGWPGYRLFFIALVLTALGSCFYHLAPDNHRLLWDRLPIALACAGLLAGVRADMHVAGRHDTALLAALATLSVLWWYLTEMLGQGDLRAYLLMQVLPLILIPLWQAIYRAPRADRIAFGIAIVLYVAAKAAELQDHQLLHGLGWISGHTVKHVLASAAAAVLVKRLIDRRAQALRTGKPVPAAHPQSSLAPAIPNS